MIDSKEKQLALPFTLLVLFCVFGVYSTFYDSPYKMIPIAELESTSGGRAPASVSAEIEIISSFNNVEAESSFDYLEDEITTDDYDYLE